MGKRQVTSNTTSSVDVAARVAVDNKLLPGDIVSMNYPDGMTPDDWDRVEGTGKYAEDYDEEEEKRYAEGPDPDAINDRRREQQEEVNWL
jgi:hypothetical protein